MLGRDIKPYPEPELKSGIAMQDRRSRLGV